MNVVRLEIVYDDVKTAKAVYDAIYPDNLILKHDISITTRLEGSKLVVSVIDYTTNMLRLRNTIDDILASIRLSERIIEAVGKADVRE